MCVIVFFRDAKLSICGHKAVCPSPLFVLAAPKALPCPRKAWSQHPRSGSTSRPKRACLYISNHGTTIPNHGTSISNHGTVIPNHETNKQVILSRQTSQSLSLIKLSLQHQYIKGLRQESTHKLNCTKYGHFYQLCSIYQPLPPQNGHIPPCHPWPVPRHTPQFSCLPLA